MKEPKDFTIPGEVLKYQTIGDPIACTDCRSEVVFMGFDNRGLPHFNVQHGDNCSWLAAQEGE